MREENPEKFYSQFMNKVLYAKGAKIITDRIFEDFPWQVRVEVDGVEIEVPEDAGVLVTISGSYMGGVDLWHNEDENFGNFDPQSMHDKILEVVSSISGTWHLGKLQAFMLKRAGEEPLGHAGSILTDVLENAESSHVIKCCSKASTFARNGTTFVHECLCRILSLLCSKGKFWRSFSLCCTVLKAFQLWLQFSLLKEILAKLSHIGTSFVASPKSKPHS